MISFASVHQAIKAEKVLEQNGISVYALPTPREIDISCGQCLLFAAGRQAEILALLTVAHVRWSKLFSRAQAEKVYIYEKLSEYGG